MNTPRHFLTTSVTAVLIGSLPLLEASASAEPAESTPQNVETQPTTEQAAAEPTPTEPAPTESTVAEPAPTEPAPTESAAAEPAPTDPAPTDPAPTEPAPTEPAPAEQVEESPEPTSQAASPEPPEPAAAVSTSTQSQKKERRPGVLPKGYRTRIDRRPFYIGLGLGIGFSGLSDQSVGGSPLAATLNIRAGGTIKDRHLVGVQAALLMQYYKWQEHETAGAAVSNVLAEYTVFPVDWLPLSLSAGLGWASAAKIFRIADTEDGDPLPVGDTGNGLAWLAAAGWDFFPGRGTNLGLQLRYEGTQSKNLGVDHAVVLGLWVNFY